MSTLMPMFSLSLSQLQCSLVSPSQTLLSADDARKLLISIVEDETGGLKIRCMCKVRDFGYGVELINRIHKRRFSPRAISKAIRRKPYHGRVPPLSSPFKLTIRFLFFRSEISFAKLRRRSVTAWDHIFSDNIFSNCKSFVFCLKDYLDDFQ
ncbi:hypothetical protein HID58_037972, partial [Brassica napus]